jgi:hypothetical protein
MDKNPFPGMNPWLESHWGDVHTRLTTYASDQLQPLLPSGLRARIEEYVSVEFDEEDGQSPSRFAPDVRVIEHPGGAEASGGIATLVAAEPLLVRRIAEPETLRYIQIVDVTAGHRIVTSLEFLSPANKAHGPGCRQYRKKQRQMLDGRVNVVEIDLLRAGGWVLAVSKDSVPKQCRRPYRICVVRAARPWTAEVYRTALDQPLPIIRIPLRCEDADVPLNLQTLIDAAYVNGRYADDIDYSKPPRPKLRGDDAQWAEGVLSEKGLHREA